MVHAELTRFFEEIAATAQSNGVVCAITSGMACVSLGLATSTKDCDLICNPQAAGAFLDTLQQSPFHDASCRYRGRISPPLDARWLRGGWTSHFEWLVPGTVVHLDVFGIPPRGSVAWEPERHGVYAGMQTIAEMKRTDRPKDWDFVTALGGLMLESGDPRGWLHIYDADMLATLFRRLPCPPDYFSRRPVLTLARNRDPLLEPAVRAECVFWQELDHVRLQIYQRAVRPYLVAVRRTVPRGKLDLADEHRLRVQCAENHLAMNPLRDYGLERMIQEARDATAQSMRAELLEWLPDVRRHFPEVVT